MGELVPTPIPPDPVTLAAIAMAAQRIVAEEMTKTKGPFVTAEEAGAIARKAVLEAFGEFDVDLDRPESIRAFNATIAAAERSRAWWEKAANTVWNGIWAAIAAGAMAVFAKYMGGAK